jgi:hypothetical protein
MAKSETTTTGMMPDSSTTDLMAEAYVRIVAAE